MSTALGSEIDRLRAELEAERQSHEFAIDQLRGIMQSRIDAAERQLADERKAHQETSRWGNATADGLYAELDKERKGHADTRRLLELQLDVTMSEYKRAEAAKQRLKQVEAQYRELAEAADGWLVAYEEEVRDPFETAPCKRLVAAVDAIRALSAARKEETP